MTPTPTDLRLFAIKARLQRATPGPWEASPDTDSYYGGDASMVTSKPRGCRVACGIEEHRDAELIAHAPADLAWLLDLVVKLSKPDTTPDGEALPNRSISLPGGPSAAQCAVTCVRAPGERYVLTLTLRPHAPMQVLQPMAVEILEADHPTLEALRLDYDNTLRLWAADRMRALALEWDKAGGGA